MAGTKAGVSTDVRGVTRIGDGTKKALSMYRVRVRHPDPERARMLDRTFVVEAATPMAAKLAAKKMFAETAAKPRRSARKTLGHHAVDWLDLKLPSIKHATRELWLSFVRKIVDDPISDVFVDALTTEHVHEWRQRQTGSNVSVNQRMRLFRRIWRSAAKRYGLEPHAVDFEELGMLPEQPKPKTWLSAEELAAILVALRETAPQWHAVVFTMAATGMRSGEVMALRRSDVDFEAGVITLSRSHYRGVEGTPKNGRTRSVPIHPELAEVLHAHCATLEREKDPGWHAEGLLFSAPLPGKKYSLRPATTLRKPLAKAAKAAGISRTVSAHTFRRTFVDLMRQEASGMVVRSIVGHADEAMTERYSSVSNRERMHATVTVLSPILSATKTGKKWGRPDSEPETSIPRDAAGADKGAG